MIPKPYFLYLFFLSITLSCSTKTEHKLESFVFDNEKIFTKEQVQEFESLFSKHEKRTTNEIVIVTTSNYGEFDNNVDFSVDFGDKHGIGKANYDNGIVIVFSKTKKEVRISTGYGTEDFIKDEIAKKIIDSLMVPKFKEDLYFEGLRDGSVAIVKILDQPENKIGLRTKKK